MKICVLAFAHASTDGRVFFRGARMLQSEGYDVTLIARGRDRRRPVRIVRRDGVRVVELPRRPTSILGRLCADPFDGLWMLLVAAVASRGARVYHCHEYQSLLIGYLLARLRGGKVIYDCHEYQPEGFAGVLAPPDSVRYERFRREFERFERWWTRRVDGVVTVNEEIGARFRRDSDKVAVLPNYPSLEEFKKASLPSPEWMESLRDKNVLVYAGYVSPNRGVGECVRLLGASALREKKDTVLLFAGAVSEKGRRQLSALAEKLGVKDRVFFTGRVSHDDMQGYVQLGTIGMNLIRPIPEKNKWAEPTKVFQYAAAGLPVVSSPVEASKKLVTEMQNGLIVNSEEPEKSAEQVAELLHDTVRLRELGKRGKEAFLQRYNLEAVFPRLHFFYKELTRECAPD